MNVGFIQSLWRFPVKSFQGEKLSEVQVGNEGILGDRAYALIDKKTGKVISAKSVRLYPDLLFCKAVFSNEPVQGEELPPVGITLADGTFVQSDDKKVDQILSNFFKREVTLARAAPEDYTIDQYHPDLENLDPYGSRNVLKEQKLGSALFKSMGVDSPISSESFMDVFPISLITSSTLDHLTELRPETNFDERRFRMNIVVKTSDPGFVENGWIGKTLTIEKKVKLPVTMPDPRCVMTALSQQGLKKDNQVLKTLVHHNRLDIMGSGSYPCAGVYAVVAGFGKIRINDPIELNESEN